ncbi:MAG TPA: TIGR00269 family protein [Thermofilaceae archaeon]|nr:TIGR00269 family protein [Thermofilaceae archaeon]
MPKCMLCSSKAAVKIPYLGGHLCSTHFSQYFERRFLQTLERFGMVREGEKVAVAVSGGKDSLTLLYLFSKYRRVLGVELVAVAIDEGIGGYRERKLMAARRYAGEWGVELVIKSFKEAFGFTLDEAVEALMRGGLRYKPCTVCGVLRRYLLNRAALELGADKLATAHNMDDEAQAFLMNMVQASFRALSREGPVSGRVHEKLVPRIKPLYFAPEREVAAYALIQGIESPPVECPYIAYSTRHIIRRWLNRVELDERSVKYRVLALKELLREPLREGAESFRTCRVCGMPSSGEVCKACSLTAYVRSLLNNSF